MVCFSVLPVNAISSYVDDIAFIKILCEQCLMWHAQLQGQGVCVLFFFKAVLTFYYF